MTPRAVATVGALLVATLWLLAGPAAAHPLGLPAFAQVVAPSANEVRVSWSASPDDVAALARSVGIDVQGDALTAEQDAGWPPARACVPSWRTR